MDPARRDRPSRRRAGEACASPGSRRASTDGGIRTPTGRFLRPVPLPGWATSARRAAGRRPWRAARRSSRRRARRPRCRALRPEAPLAAGLESDHLCRTRLRRMPSRDQREMPVHVRSSLFYGVHGHVSVAESLLAASRLGQTRQDSNPGLASLELAALPVTPRICEADDPGRTGLPGVALRCSSD
jgi:hypothetical protein